jgi:WD40 repeat protein
MKIKVYTWESESFRYGDSEGVKVWRYVSKELRDLEYDKEIQAMRNIPDLTEYEPECFEDSIHKWAYDYRKKDDTVEIIESEPGELLKELIIDSRKDKINKLIK